MLHKNIKLRTYEVEDNAFIHDLVNNPDIMAYWFEEPHVSRTRMDEIFEKSMNDPTVRSFILVNGDEPLGLVKLFDIHSVHRKAEYAIMIDPKQQGNGYAPIATKLAMEYAFNILNLHKLYLYVDEENAVARHVYKKCGYEEIATLKEEFFVKGSYHDVVVMNIFKRDYDKMIAVEK